MKFFHVGDLHFGKTLHNVPLIDKDQPYWVEQFINAVDEHNPDAVVIAGDVYDRKIPSPEAMKLFDHLITELSRRNKYVFVIPGNHDSSARLSHVNELLTSHKIYIAGELQKELTHITVPGETTDVTFWLMPYIFPKLVSDERVLNQDELSTYDAAARALLEAQSIDRGACNVLIAHQNVLANGIAPEHSGSETIIGGLGEIEYSAFDAFDYVALGHIHNAQKVGRETVRYSGCPLFYDFSELNRNKNLTLVTIGSKEKIEIQQVDIPLLHKLVQKTGTLEELLSEGSKMENKDQYYIQCVLCDKHVPSRALEQLRDVYGDQLVNVKRGMIDAPSSAAYLPNDTDGQKMNLEEQFSLFFQSQQNEMLDGDQEGLVKMILEQQTRHSGDYILDGKPVPEKDSQELLDFLFRATMEDNK